MQWIFCMPFYLVCYPFLLDPSNYSYLDEQVKNRSKKTEEQLNLFHEYADINSYEVRAPLARILGLLYIIQHEEDKEKINVLIKKLNDAAKELHDVIRHMNRLLEKETFSKLSK